LRADFEYTTKKPLTAMWKWEVEEALSQLARIIQGYFDSSPRFGLPLHPRRHRGGTTHVTLILDGRAEEFTGKVEDVEAALKSASLDSDLQIASVRPGSVILEIEVSDDGAQM